MRTRAASPTPMSISICGFSRPSDVLRQAREWRVGSRESRRPCPARFKFKLRSQESSHAQSAQCAVRASRSDLGTRHSGSLDTLYQYQDHACGRTYAARAISLVQCGAARVHTVVGQLQAADVKGGKSAIQGSDLRRSPLTFVLAFARALWSVGVYTMESEIRILRAAEVRRASDHDALMPGGWAYGDRLR